MSKIGRPGRKRISFRTSYNNNRSNKDQNVGRPCYPSPTSPTVKFSKNIFIECKIQPGQVSCRDVTRGSTKNGTSFQHSSGIPFAV